MSTGGEEQPVPSPQDVEERLKAVEARQDALSRKLDAIVTALFGEGLSDYTEDYPVATRLTGVENHVTAVGRKVSRLKDAVAETPGADDPAPDGEPEGAPEDASTDP